MGLLARLSSFIRNFRRTNTDRPTERIWFSPRTATNITVNHDTALNYAAVWAAVRCITESLSQMSWHVFAQKKDARERQAMHPVDWMLSVQTNPELPAFTFRETMLAWALTWGNGYAEIERDMAGRAVAMWPIAPDRIAVDRTAAGQLVYDIRNRYQANTVLLPSDIFHLHGLGFDGSQGYSVIALARQSIGMGLAAEEYGARFFGNDARPSGILEHPAALKPEAAQRIKDDWQKIYAGTGRHSVAVLEEGMKYNRIGLSNEDAQFLQTRRFQVQEIARWFRVPPHKIGDLERATFSNIEHQAIEFVVDCLVPWAVRLEQEANAKLFGANRQTLFTKMNVASLLRGDQSSRFSAYATGRQWGWLSVNDIRRLEDMNPLPPHLGDVFLTPTNMYAVPLDPNKAVTGPPALAPAPAREQPEDEEDAMRAALAVQLTEYRNGHAGDLR